MPLTYTTNLTERSSDLPFKVGFGSGFKSILCVLSDIFLLYLNPFLYGYGISSTWIKHPSIPSIYFIPLPTPLWPSHLSLNLPLNLQGLRLSADTITHSSWSLDCRNLSLSTVMISAWVHQADKLWDICEMNPGIVKMCVYLIWSEETETWRFGLHGFIQSIEHSFWHGCNPNFMFI